MVGVLVGTAVCERAQQTQPSSAVVSLEKNAVEQFKCTLLAVDCRELYRKRASGPVRLFIFAVRITQFAGKRRPHRPVVSETPGSEPEDAPGRVRVDQGRVHTHHFCRPGREGNGQREREQKGSPDAAHSHHPAITKPVPRIAAQQAHS